MSWDPAILIRTKTERKFLILTQLYKEIRHSPSILFLLLLTALKRCVLYYSIDTRGAADSTYIIENSWQQRRAFFKHALETQISCKAVNAGMMFARFVCNR